MDGILAKPGFEREVEALARTIHDAKKRYPEFDARKARLRFLCTDMIARLESTVDTRFAYFAVHVQEAGYLALSLGFNDPPVQLLTYHRDGEDIVSPPSREFPQRQPVQWDQLRVRQKDVCHAVAYRINDPAGIPGLDLIVCALKDDSEAHVDEVPGSNEPIREYLVEFLGRWVRAIDGLQPPVQQPKEHAHPVRPDADGKAPEPTPTAPDITTKRGKLMAAKLFFSYAHEDETFKDELIKHLATLKRQGVIETWNDREITAGDEWKGQIDANLEAADVILLLVSSDFLASDYCFDVEMKRAIKRHQAGEARVIPVILRPVDWKGLEFGRLQALPTDAKAVTEWRNLDSAFADVAKGIRKAVEKSHP